jgi:imidazolonepropionase-like amidohydrolase
MLIYFEDIRRKEKMKTCKPVLILAAIVVYGLLTPTVFAGSGKAIVGATVVDIHGNEPIENAVVLIEGERITAIARAGSVEVPSTAEVIDASGTWLIPGMMNMHVHLGLILPGKLAAQLANESEAELALRMAAAAREVLHAGITTVRMPGDNRHGDLALKKAIARGQATGPRIFSAGQALSISGGHGGKGSKPTYDGPYELMKAARKEISSGATWIKIAISGGIATDGGEIAEALMTPEEIHAVIDASHRFGARVAAHSGSSAATTVAVEAGIDSIEHGYFLDREVLRLMHKNGTWLVPTILVSQPALQPFFEEIGSPPWYLARRDSVAKHHWKALEMAIEEGVNIALGTDQLPSAPTDGTTATAREAQYYVEAGMTPQQALRSATIEPARMLGADDEIGSLEAGKYADIVALAENPIDSAKALDHVVLVMKGGSVYRNELEQD